VLFLSLGWNPTIMFFCIWAALGLVVYFTFARKHSNLGRGVDIE
jgi:APA family basic amino acid/polyamine antiporter